MAGLTIDTLQELVRVAVKKAQEDFKRPMCLAIYDQYGFLLSFIRMEGVPVRSINIAHGKAYTAARMGVNSADFLERLYRENIPASYFCDDKLTGLPGGIVLKDKNGTVVGGVGISGLASSEDEEIGNALAAIVAS